MAKKGDKNFNDLILPESDDKKSGEKAVEAEVIAPEEILQEIGFTGENENVSGDTVPVPELPKKKRRKGSGRKSKEEIEAEKLQAEMLAKIDILLEAGISGLLVLLADLGAKFLSDETWRLTEAEEISGYAGAVKMYLKIRFPDWIDTPEAGLALALSGYLFKRL